MKHTTHNQRQAIVGCLLGTAVGDALGLSCEGLSRRRIAKLYPDLNRYHFFFTKGMMSDDTEHSSLVAQALIIAQGDEQQFIHALAWKLRIWLLGMPAGIGFATLRAIIKLWLGVSPQYSGVFSAGNGAAMRIALIGVCFGNEPEKLQTFVRITTRITHTDPKAEWGAFAIALAAYLASLQEDISPQVYLNILANYLPHAEPAFLYRIQRAVDSVNTQQTTLDFAAQLGLTKGISGYVYDTVPLVIHAWLSHQQDYAGAVQNLIRCGGDTDTTAAIVGAIVGARVGKTGIPNLWLENLWDYPRSVQWLEGLSERLADSLQGATRPYRLFFLPLIIRNILFTIIVLGHGLRRLFPPY
ncbi:ADP-ribosylglycohydrolase family protein [Beggiatoa leptomitoformis]|uniref:ADP-ribosylglycohydrolase family protein n=1 Tax=Beggiatoa leptomitoformis TaxID=288004 RepID=A0A2N9YGE2_9GAMM|nr:ADP-ribosylglycohydrolase family protein [Beggiatoa leptomitoformis]ALG68146.1 ADP-ribosylglycohydrolase family protein [Beggiatoa leptomitoformis]AUI69557.1 ADP-ribosylglycohydrolase family protein [Beggiatoa leptomitoformis]